MPRAGEDRVLRFAARVIAACLVAASVVAGATRARAQAAPDTAVSFVTPAHSRPAPMSAAVESAATVATPPPSRAPAPGSPTDGRPATLNDLNAWLDYKVRRQIPALPDEARLFYRRGLMAYESGAMEDAIQLVRGASQLDPAFTRPYVTLGSWFLVREPGQALAQYAGLLEVARQSFTFQLALEANTLYAAVQALLLGLIAVGLMIIAARNHELRHRWQERFTRFARPRRARFWAWVVLVLPFCVGLGPALPAVMLLGLLWPLLKWGERTAFVMLVASLITMPLLISELDRLGSPLREDREPLFGVLRMQDEHYSSALAGRLATLVRQHPDNAFVHFGRAWVARRGNDLVTAEASYRRALELWPDDDRVLNNLGNVLTLLGRNDEALDAYERSANANPFNAAAHYNRARIYTDRYEFRAASEAMARASALNFDLLKPYQTQMGTHEALPPADLWIAPRRFWNALAEYRPPTDELLAVPPRWRSRLECSGWLFSLAVLVCSLAGVLLGVLQHRRMPLRYCGNCGHVVCRRCAERRREIALCKACAAVERRAEVPEYGRLLLAGHQRSARRRDRALRTAFATLLPGFGWVAHRRVFAAWVLLSITAGLISVTMDLAAPFSYEPRLSHPDSTVPLSYVVLPWIAIYLISMAGYFFEAQRERVRLEASSSVSSPRHPRRRLNSQAA